MPLKVSKPSNFEAVEGSIYVIVIIYLVNLDAYQ